MKCPFSHNNKRARKKIKKKQKESMARGSVLYITAKYGTL
jgi:hypothetical protein